MKNPPNQRTAQGLWDHPQKNTWYPINKDVQKKYFTCSKQKSLFLNTMAFLVFNRRNDSSVQFKSYRKVGKMVSPSIFIT